MEKRNVYLVDDEEPVRWSIKVMLNVQGHQVTTFDSGMSLLNVADALVPGCILLDIRMPDMDGVEVQRQLNAKGVGLPVVMMTGHGDLSVAAEALQRGAVAFLEKPFAKTALIDALDAAFLRLEDPAAYDRQRSAAAASVHALSEADRALLAQLATGRSSERIAAELGISTASAEMRRARLFSELGVQSICEAMRIAAAAGLQPPD